MEIVADLAQIAPELDQTDLAARLQAPMRAGDGGDPARRLLQVPAHLGLLGARRLQVQHAHHQLQAVADPMVQLLKQDLPLLDRPAQAALDPLPLDRHAQQVRRPLQEGDVVLAELTLVAAVDLEHAIGLAVALEDHVHGAADAVLDQKIGGAEALLVLQVVGDHGLAGAQGVASGRGEVRPDAGLADDPRRPADPGADQEQVLGRLVLEHLGEVRAQALGGEPRGQVEQLRERRALECLDAQLGQQFLLAHALAQLAQARALRLLAGGRLLDHRLATFVHHGQDPALLRL